MTLAHTMAAPETPSPDIDHLATLLKALAQPTRLRLLWALRSPQRPGDVTIPASQSRDGLREGRPLSRPAIVQHLQVLEELGVVRQTEPKGPFVVDQQIMFAVVSELGRLASIQPEVASDVGETMATDHGPGTRLPDGPKLVVVGGPREGQAFELDGEGPWSLGREDENDIQLAYDPHVSGEHVRIRREEDGSFAITPAREPTNPPLLDLQPLIQGTWAPLYPGAILSVGGSRLVFKVL